MCSQDKEAPKEGSQKVRRGGGGVVLATVQQCAFKHA